MKKMIASILILTSMATVCTTTAFADSKGNKGNGAVPYGLAKKYQGLPTGIAKKIFDDIDDIQWAKPAIELMKTKGLIQGYGDGKFAPNNQVTKLETVIMALRVLGWENEAGYIKTLPQKYKGGNAGQWANGYIAVAYEKGILDDVDMMYFKPNDPASRYEVAKYVIRALGYEKEAQQHMDEKLSFVDAGIIPQGAVGYVYLVNDMKLMQGDDNRAFNPFGTLTRAEMAVLFYRLDQKVDSGVDQNEVKGEVSSVSEDEIVLTVDGREKTFVVDDDVIAYDDQRRIPYSDIEEGDKVILELIDNKVVSITVTDGNTDQDKIISRYTGEVAALDQNSPKEITVQIEKMKITFEAISGIAVYFNNQEGSFSDIEIGDQVTVVVDTLNRAREIYVDRDLEDKDTETVKGYISEIDLSGTYHLTIDNETYVLSKDAEVQIPGVSNEELSDLKAGYYAECELVNDVVEKVYAEDRMDEVSGSIYDINRDSIEIKVGSTVKSYSYADAFEVYINDRSSSYTDLDEGMTATLKIRNNIVYEIDAQD